MNTGNSLLYSFMHSYSGFKLRGETETQKTKKQNKAKLQEHTLDLHHCKTNKQKKEKGKKKKKRRKIEKNNNKWNKVYINSMTDTDVHY